MLVVTGLPWVLQSLVTAFRGRVFVMNVPLAVSFLYLALGMLTVVSSWPNLQDELELAISMEEPEFHGPLRSFMWVLMVLAWPFVLWELLRRK